MIASFEPISNFASTKAIFSVICFIIGFIVIHVMFSSGKKQEHNEH